VPQLRNPKNSSSWMASARLWGVELLRWTLLGDRDRLSAEARADLDRSVLDPASAAPAHAPPARFQ
jgi:hypothetical protein